MSDRFLDLLRHGAVRGGTCFRGRQDDPLSGLGWGQMSDATADDPGWTEIISSPARRCADFAHHLAARRALTMKIEERLCERHFGDWEGLTASEIQPDALGRFWGDPVGYTPPGAEPYPLFRERVLHVWNNLRQSSARHALLVTHGGVIRVLIAATLRMPDDAALLIEVSHACHTRVRLPQPPGQPSLVFHRGSE
jgi:alpha-ribazole phosphatase